MTPIASLASLASADALIETSFDPDIGLLDRIVGDGGNNDLEGTAGDDVIKGRGGNDAIFAGDGDDLIYGGAGDDLLFGEAGDNTVNGGAGFDTAGVTVTAETGETVDLSGFHTGETFKLRDGDRGSDLLQGIEQLDVQVQGGAARVIGSAEADSIDVFGFGSHLTAGNGNDTISGAGGSVVNGQGGDDFLFFNEIAWSDTTVFNGGGGQDIFEMTLSDTTSGLRIKPTSNGFIGGTADHQHDFIASNTERLFVFDTSGAATITGGDGDDDLSAISRDGLNGDLLRGEAGDDHLTGGGTNDILNGGAGDDTIDGIAGSDTLNGGGGTDQYVYRIGGYDSGQHAYVIDASHFDISGRTFTLDLGEDQVVTLTSFEAVQLDGDYIDPNLLKGSDGDDRLNGGSAGDTLIGGDGRDVLFGDVGGDRLSGGHGADRFLYEDTSDSTAAQPDLITDLTDQEVIDLSSIDANPKEHGDQAFVIVSALNGHAGQLALSYDAKTNLTTLVADVDGDGQADMTILISGDHSGFTNFVL